MSDPQPIPDDDNVHGESEKRDGTPGSPLVETTPEETTPEEDPV